MVLALYKRPIRLARSLYNVSLSVLSSTSPIALLRSASESTLLFTSSFFRPTYRFDHPPTTRSLSNMTVPVPVPVTPTVEQPIDVLLIGLGSIGSIYAYLLERVSPRQHLCAQVKL